MRRAALVVGFTVIAVGGVTIPSTGAAGHSQFDGAPAAQSRAVAPASNLDRDAATVQATKDVPEFGGAFVDEKAGALHVWLTRPSAGTAARVRGALATRLGLTAAGTATVVHRADYSFAQLKTWHDGMAEVLGTPGVTMTDIDDRTNRLTVGVEDAGLAASAVASVLAKVGIPQTAVTVVTATAVTPNLRDRTRPLHAGTQIQLGGGGNCTLGFPANRGGTFGFVTNSHCSTIRSAVDSGDYWQSTRPAGGGDTVGVETVDPAMFTGAGCPAGRSCRRSDANFVRTNNGAPISQGRIARAPIGSLDWNGTDTFRINTVGQAFNGDAVQKVGRTTGRTAGPVTSTCVNSNVAGTTFTMLCQDRASYTAGGGDSGSPVFVLTNNPAPNDVRAVGIHWGTGAVGGVPSSVYSPFFQVREELGESIRVCDVGVAGGC